MVRLFNGHQESGGVTKNINISIGFIKAYLKLELVESWFHGGMIRLEVESPSILSKLANVSKCRSVDTCHSCVSVALHD